MPQVQAVQSTQHAEYSWLPVANYSFAAKDAYAPLLIQEFMQAGAMAPVAFTRSDEGYRPGLVMGMTAGQNRLVSEQGKWRGNYVPAYYRSHPFCMAKDPSGKTLLSFHADSECVQQRYVAGGKAKPFFVAGELSTELSEVREFLRQVEAGRQITAAFAARCAELELFCPWETQPISGGGQPLKIKGLYRIDEKKLRALPAAIAKALLETGALGAIYHHLGSLQHTWKLLNPTQPHSHDADKAAEALPEILTHAAADEPTALDWAAIVQQTNG